MTSTRIVWDQNALPDLDGMTLTEAAAALAKLSEQHPPETKIDWTQVEAWAGDGYNYVMRVPRPETDDEKAARLIAERTNKERQEAQERAQFARLKAKFG
jgi:hypothetical protein